MDGAKIITLSPELMAQRSKECNAEAEAMDSIIKNTQTLMGNLSAEWKGAAYDRYAAAYDQNKAALEKVSELLHTLSSNLATIAKNMAELDSTMASQM